MIKKLGDCIIQNADRISEAQAADRVCPSNFTGAAGMLTGAMYHYLGNVPKWAAPVSLEDTMPAERRGGIDCDWLCVSEPKGLVLNIAPWNAPVLLSVLPCLGALAAGNCCIIKPPDAAPATSKLLSELISAAMPPTAVAVAEGGVKVVEGLIDLGFDHIMFTGGTNIGSIVMARAARTLTPVTLELGGKNPVYVDEMDEGMLAAAVKEIVGTKAAFSGEFCQCHDILFVSDGMYDRFMAQMTKGIEGLGERRMVNLIHQGHYKRVKAMLDGHHGKSVPAPPACDDAGLRLPVTMVVDPQAGDLIYKDEVFGPMWVVFRVPSIEEAMGRANSLPTGKPLVSYYYGQSMENADKWQGGTSSGCLAVNSGPMRMQSNFNAAVHGVGNSGMGGASIWGHHVFDTFTHKKHVVRPRDGAFAGSIWGAGAYKPAAK
jgi:aldehyde dehydrogenase (NAD+)